MLSLGFPRGFESHYQWRSQGGGTLSLHMIQSSHRFGLSASSPNLSESCLAGWAEVLGFAAPTLTAQNWIQTNLTTRGGPIRLALLNRLCRDMGLSPKPRGVFAARMQLGAPPPDPPPERGLWQSPSEPQLHSCGEDALGFGAEPRVPA